MAHVIPYGKEKGVAITSASEAGLRWVAGTISEKLETDPDSRFAGQNRELLAAIHAELKSRGVDPGQSTATESPRAAAAPRQQAPQRAQQITAMARSQEAPQRIVAGTFANGEAASRALLEASQKYHLVSPATVVGRLPEGCEVVVSVVQIDPYSSDVYCITGNAKNPRDDDTVGLDRVALAKIAAAAGVTWVSSRRTDDGSHPHYCAWEAIARFQNFDMTSSDIPGNVDIDTREDGDVRGAAAEEIRTKARAKGAEDGGDKQLLELRKFLVRHCESKAMNKAIGNKGVRRSYKRADLKKPFAVARLIFTGHSEDPEARREFRQMIGQRFLGASHQLYGPTVQTMAPALAAPQPAPVQYLPSPPPPIGMTVDSWDHSPDGDAPPAAPTPRKATPQEQEEEQPYADEYADRGGL